MELSPRKANDLPHPEQIPTQIITHPKPTTQQHIPSTKNKKPPKIQKAQNRQKHPECLRESSRSETRNLYSSLSDAHSHLQPLHLSMTSIPLEITEGRNALHSDHLSLQEAQKQLALKQHELHTTLTLNQHLASQLHRQSKLVHDANSERQHRIQIQQYCVKLNHSNQCAKKELSEKQEVQVKSRKFMLLAKQYYVFRLMRSVWALFKKSVWVNKVFLGKRSVNFFFFFF